MLATGYWPPYDEFDTRDLATVIKVAEERNKKR